METEEKTYKVLSGRHEMGNVLVIEGKGLTREEATRLVERLRRLDIFAWTEEERHKD